MYTYGNNEMFIYNGDPDVSALLVVPQLLYVGVLHYLEEEPGVVDADAVHLKRCTLLLHYVTYNT